MSAEDGIVSYSRGATDTDTAGLYMAEWEVTFAGGIPMTFPGNGHLYVNVEPDLGDEKSPAGHRPRGAFFVLGRFSSPGRCA